MKLKTYVDYIDELHEVYPKIDKKQLKRIIRTFLHLLVEALSRNEDIVLKTKNFFLGIVSVRDKKEADRFSYMKYKQLNRYRKNRRLNKKHENEQKNSSNKHV